MKVRVECQECGTFEVNGPIENARDEILEHLMLTHEATTWVEHGYPEEDEG